MFLPRISARTQALCRPDPCECVPQVFLPRQEHPVYSKRRFLPSAGPCRSLDRASSRKLCSRFLLSGSSLPPPHSLPRERPPTAPAPPPYATPLAVSWPPPFSLARDCTRRSEEHTSELQSRG